VPRDFGGFKPNQKYWYYTKIKFGLGHHHKSTRNRRSCSMKKTLKNHMTMYLYYQQKNPVIAMIFLEM